VVADPHPTREAQQDSVLPLEQQEWFKQLEKKHPIEASIANAAHQRFLEVRDLLSSYLTEPAPVLAEFLAKLTTLGSEIRELMSWVSDPKFGIQLSEVIAMCDTLTRAYVEGGGRNVGEVSEFIRSAALRKPLGRPVELRLAAVRGLETKHSAPDLPWKDIAQLVWPSKEERNIEDPGQSLRHEVIALRKVLRKYGLRGCEPFPRHPAREGKTRERKSK
jgi:hypothetical protein